jgi:hypothetical protein
MIELMIETWNDPRGTQYRWSLWKDGTRIGMGGPHAAPEASEAQGCAFCTAEFQRHPDRITRL